MLNPRGVLILLHRSVTGNYCVSRNALEMDGARIRRNNAHYLHVVFQPTRIAPAMVQNGHSLAALLGIAGSNAFIS